MAARLATVGLLASALAACGSDPASEQREEPGSAIPDYTRSPCYGNTTTTVVYDAETHGTREVSATCRAEGERTLVYVADDLWETPIAQADVDAFMIGYELEGRAASYAPELGVLPTDELVFGPLDRRSLPGGKLPIFIVDSGGAGEGYLCGFCAGVELHLDGPLLGSLSSDETFSIAAHETVHAIHRAYDANESVWVDETLAQAAMTVNGFFTDTDWLDDFLSDTNVSWGPHTNDPLAYHYGAGLLFGSYLWERGGQRLLHAIVSEPLDDWAGLDAALAATGDPADAWNVYLDMGLAAFLDDPASGHSFESFELEGAIAPTLAATGTTLSETIRAYGIVFVVFDGDAARVTLDAGSNVATRLVFDGSRADVHELVPGQPFELDATPRVLLLSARVTASFSLSVE